MNIRIMTFETFAKKDSWFNYWLQERPWNHTLWLDRSPCSEPFLDPIHVKGPGHQPTLGGLCRPNLPLKVGDVRVYVAKIDPGIAKNRLAPYVNAQQWKANDGGLYAVVAVLEIVILYRSHVLASQAFSRQQPRRFVPGQPPTHYPPNLLWAPRPDYTVPKPWCIAYARGKPYLPTDAHYDAAYHVNVKEYYSRASRQGFAVCRAQYINLDHPTVLTGSELIGLAPGNPKYHAGNVSGRSITAHELVCIMKAL